MTHDAKMQKFITFTFLVSMGIALESSRTGPIRATVQIGQNPCHQTDNDALTLDHSDCSKGYACVGIDKISVTYSCEQSCLNLSTGTCDISNGEIRVSKPMGQCPKEDPPTPVYLPDDTDKHKFYECSYGVPVPLYCPGNQCFNPDKNVCGDPCDNSLPILLMKTLINSKCSSDGSYFNYPDNQDRHVFYRCSNGFVKMIRCPRGLCFLRNLRKCGRCEEKKEEEIYTVDSYEEDSSEEQR